MKTKYHKLYLELIREVKSADIFPINRHETAIARLRKSESSNKGSNGCKLLFPPITEE